MKTTQHLDNQKIGNLEENLTRENESLELEYNKNNQLRKSIDNERDLVKKMKQEVMTVEEKLRQEQIKCRDEKTQKEINEKALQEEKNNIERLKKYVFKDQHKNKEDITVLSDKIKDLELEVTQLSKQVCSSFLSS